MSILMSVWQILFLTYLYSVFPPGNNKNPYLWNLALPLRKNTAILIEPNLFLLKMLVFYAFDICIWQWSYQLKYPGLLSMSLCLFQIPPDIFLFFIKMWVSFCGSYCQKEIELCHFLTSFTRYTLCILAESFMFTRGTTHQTFLGLKWWILLENLS